MNKPNLKADEIKFCIFCKQSEQTKIGSEKTGIFCKYCGRFISNPAKTIEIPQKQELNFDNHSYITSNPIFCRTGFCLSTEVSKKFNCETC